ncbi:PH domain-containing protein [Candidatus Microgenomates bacterium]|nr:PH domain-containing protein [Candidatus Microgenomates bacterium]
MATLAEVKVQLRDKIGATRRMLGRGEIQELPRILGADETIEKAVEGVYGGGFGLLVATNKRLLFIDKKPMECKVEEVPYSPMMNARYDSGLVFGKITIDSAGKKLEIQKVNKRVVRDFVEHVESKLGAGEAARQEQPSPPQASADPPPIDMDHVLWQLERLTMLRERGALSEEEFITQKQRILGAVQKD